MRVGRVSSIGVLGRGEGVLDEDEPVFKRKTANWKLELAVVAGERKS